jgi:DUF1680 family protein
MDGEKCANFHSIVFQSRPGSPELNCCSVNAPRGVGMLSEWMLMMRDDTVYINYFSDFAATTDSGLRVSVTGDYPAHHQVTIKICSVGIQKVAIRIPGWSTNTKIVFNNRHIEAQPATYLMIEHEWKNDSIQIDFDFSARFEEGDLDYFGMKSLYKGPILFGYDLSDNPSANFGMLPPIPFAEVACTRLEKTDDGRMILRLNCGITLKDFYHLGQSGCQYKTWLKFK